MVDEQRSRVARRAAEAALVRVIHHYGSRPEFVVIGGLVPELLCAGSEFRHAGTTDIDVQVNLEIACGAVNTARLERALRNAEFVPTSERIWRWVVDDGQGRPMILVKFELLADLDTTPAGDIFSFEGCKDLGAVNLRGTAFAARHFDVVNLKAKVSDTTYEVQVNVASIAGFLLAKAAAAYSRRKAKDWYDIAFVLLHNSGGGINFAADEVRAKFKDELVGSVRIALDDLLANFDSPKCQGPEAYSEQMSADHPELDKKMLIADAVVAVKEFYDLLFSGV